MPISLVDRLQNKIARLDGMAQMAAALSAATAQIAEMNKELQEIKQRVYMMDVFDYRNVFKHAHQIGSISSARYWMEHMDGLPGFNHRDQLLAFALDSVTLDGQWLEFGVADGGSISWTAQRHPNQTIHGFDSFEGIPEKWAFNVQFAYDRGGVLPDVPSNVVLHKGWFDATVPPFFEQNRQPIAFMHVDCDIYSSTKCIFDHSWDLMRPGTIIQFDEYWNYAGWENHEHKAFLEMIRERGMTYEYIGQVSISEQVAVKITGVSG